MRHPAILLLVLAAHAALLTVALHPDRPAAAARRPAAAAAAAYRPEAAARSLRPTRPGPPAPATTAAAAAATTRDRLTPQAWLDAQEHARRQFRERRFGGPVASLLAAPDDGLAALAERARHGDAAALDAWLLRADDCQGVDRPPAAVLATLSSEREPDAVPDPRRQFADALVQARREADAQRALACARANGDRARLEADWAALAQEVRTPAAQRALAELQYDQDGDLAALLARLRALLREGGDAAAALALAQHLTESADAAEREDGLARLRDLARQDSEALSALAQCLAIGCGALAPRPEQVGDLLQRSAELGFAWALERAIDTALRREERVAALGWSRYRAWLNAYGCFAAPDDLGLRFYLADLRLEEQVGDSLTAPERAAADALAAAHVRRAGALARRRAACD